RQLMRFLGMAGYYRKLCNNFSVIAEPLTNLLQEDENGATFFCYFLKKFNKHQRNYSTVEKEARNRP
ncbi:MAG: hypothetical protein N0C90_21585, partial [Candidatus Thiodiazotropha endolucinida]|nr:hypothetical protein [Candidatus Thiodiazotropha taylori]MCW4263948.1 hypothetical protein [Candidatus Thiodiazotropha endolucinida]